MPPGNKDRMAYPSSNQTDIPQGEVKLKRLGAPVTAIPGVGPAKAGNLAKLGIRTIGDLLYHFPRKYLDRSNVTPIFEIADNQEVTVVGNVYDVESRIGRSRKRILTVTIFDGTGYVSGVWFNQDYHREKLTQGTEVSFSGKVQFRHGGLQIVNPAYDILSSGDGEPGGETIHTGRIIPVYPATAGVTSAALRRVVSYGFEIIAGIADPIPGAIKGKHKLMDFEQALREMHFPTGRDSLIKAKYRVNFEEIFFMQVGLALRKKLHAETVKGRSHKPPGQLMRDFTGRLPFELTESQKTAWAEISDDMVQAGQMNRLLQGEVGSGKTVVALMALLLTVENGFQGAVMSPTEVLARQHLARIREMLGDMPVSVDLLISGAGKQVKDAISKGEVDLVIGTHALIQEKIKFKNLGLAVIDEQQRFGLNQREEFLLKGEQPDVLYLSATPIPRTLAMTVYGDLDISTIKEVPGGRKGVVTVVADESQRKGAYEMVRKELSMSRQVFVICPMIEESGKLEVRAAEAEAKKLSTVFKEYNVGLLHGKMDGSDKKAVMERFEAGEIDILISTVVIEVGIDIPNATVMIVENADRFGLTQLHQLRGRVGRGTERAVCVLFAEPATPEAKARMEAIGKYSDGFSLAEADLEIRGEGALFGTRQSGYSDIRISSLVHNVDLIKKARKTAFDMIGGRFDLLQQEKKLVQWETDRRFGENLEWLFKG